jgi:hypothetical protein
MSSPTPTHVGLRRAILTGVRARRQGRTSSLRCGRSTLTSDRAPQRLSNYEAQPGGGSVP